MALLAIMLAGVLDFLTGMDLDFSIFYLLPIYWIIWHGGIRPGAVASLAGAVAWLLADLLGGHLYTSVLMPGRSTFFRFSVFFLTAFLLARLKAAEERRRIFERIFFHDILNVIGAIRGYAELLQKGEIPEKREIIHIIHSGANQVIEQIELQKMVASAENRELVVNAATAVPFFPRAAGAVLW